MMGPGWPYNILQPGDCLLYRPSGLVGWLIAIRTIRTLAHVEVYDGDGYAVASRDGRGVNRYTLRTAQLGKILRPRGALDLAKARAWFERYARGQRYDWYAIARFMMPHVLTRDVDLDRMICSAFVTRYYRAGGFDAVARDMDADLVAPATFDYLPTFDAVWTDGRP